MATRLMRIILGASGKVLVTAVLLAVVASSTIADDKAAIRPDDASATLKRIFANWKARADRVKSFHFVWDSRVGIPKGATDPFAHHGDPLPKTFCEIKYSLRDTEFWAEGNDHFRYEFFKPSVHRDGSFDTKARHRITFDGTHYLVLSLPFGDPPQGYIRHLQPSDFELDPLNPLVPRLKRRRSSRYPERSFYDLHDAILQPLVVTFRPFVPVPGWEIEHCRVIPEESEKGGLIKLECQDPSWPGEKCCWVDSTRDDIVVDMEFWAHSGKHKPLVSTSIEYQRDKTVGWVPTRWTVEFVGLAGIKNQFSEYTVTKYTINEHAPPETFLLTYAPGTLIFDRSQNEFFVRRDGSMRPVPRDRKRPSYEQLLKEDDTVPPQNRK